VKGLDAAKAKVTWGGGSKSFTREELEKGINLADHFFENPFSDTFRKLDGMVWTKQNFETTMIKTVINGIPRLVDTMGKDKGLEASTEALRKQYLETHEKLCVSLHTAILPLKHAIAVAPE